MMKLSICYVTNRRHPMVSWFVDSLANQTTPEQRADIQLVFIDGHLWDKSHPFLQNAPELQFANPAFHDGARRLELAKAVADRFQYLHLPPKPCAYQGPFRQTTRDMFCAGNSRNTAFIVAKAPYVMFVDDLSVLGDQWFNQVLHAAKDGYVLAGAYKKLKDLLVEGGKIISFDPVFTKGIDSRWERGSDGGVVPWSGGGIYGCSFGVPLEAALEVDGNDGAHLAQGQEDCDFGLRLERAGWPVFYNRNCFTAESEELHHDGSTLPRERKLVSRDRLPPHYESYKVPNEAEKYFSDHVVLNRLCNETDRITPLIGDNLRALRERYQATGLVPIPREPMVDWRTGEPLSSL